jgi:hypothetical protein
MNSPPDSSSAHTLIRGTLSGLLTAVILALFCGPAFALPSATGRAVQFNQGIPVYWPYHVLFISMGFILLVAGFIVARLHKTGNWYKTHMILQTAGGASVITGLFIGIYMVAVSGFPHLRNIHEILGVTIGILLIITITLGYFIRRINKSKNAVRISHRWLGRISLALMAVNIALGLLFLSILLGR